LDSHTSIHSLHVFEQSRSLRGDGIVGEFWRDLRTPRERYTLRNRSGLNIEFGWDDRGVWQIVDGRRNEELYKGIMSNRHNVACQLQSS
jgi:hypothetical protein